MYIVSPLRSPSRRKRWELRCLGLEPCVLGGKTRRARVAKQFLRRSTLTVRVCTQNEERNIAMTTKL